MKKIFSILGMSLMLSSSVFASVPIYIDSVQVPTEPQQYYSSEARDYVDSKYYMDVTPELNNGRVFIPINVIATYFNIPITWNAPNVGMTYNGSDLVLTIGENKATINGETIELDAAAYISDGRTMVPLRFVAETFSLDVNYIDSSVYIETPRAVSRSSSNIVGLQQYSAGTMGGVTDETRTNLCITSYRELFMSFMTNENEMEEPDDLEKWSRDGLGMYQYSGDYTYVDDTGEVVERYEIYYETDNLIMTGKWMMKDTVQDKCYEMTDIMDKLRELYLLGDWERVSNTWV